MRQEELVRPATTCRRTIRCQPNTSPNEPCMTLHADGGHLLPRPWSVHSEASSSKAVAFQFVFSVTLLYYTCVKFNQEKNETGIRRWGNAGPGGCAPAAAVTIRSVEGIRRSGQDF
jgi:hypothetical protein